MKILVVGNGGREHALCFKLKETAEVICAPGNPGIEQEVKCFNISVDDILGLVNLAKSQNVSMVVVGPELPLSIGLVDALNVEGIVAFGPSKNASKLESSKAFAKEVMVTAGVPTASYEEFTEINEAKKAIEHATKLPIVLKADGLAAGKGVVVALTKEEALASLPDLFKINETGKSTSKLVIEDFLKGEEVSFIIATDGDRVVPFSTAHDYKRLLDDDNGPNTGGMGTVSPSPRISEERTNELIEKVITPVLVEMKKRETPFVGFLYAGLMISKNGEINVVEYNARMGDPECQVLMSRCEGDLSALLYALATKSTSLPEISFNKKSAVSIVLASSGYPQSPRKGDFITGLELANSMGDVKVFHAGTAKNKEEQLITSGGRVLNVTAIGVNLSDASSKANKASDVIQFAGVQRRRDIGIK